MAALPTHRPAGWHGCSRSRRGCPGYRASRLSGDGIGALDRLGDRGAGVGRLRRDRRGAVILILAGMLRLGFVTNFLPEPALTGFLFGMAMIIVVRQAGKIVGVSTGEGDFFESGPTGSWTSATPTGSASASCGWPARPTRRRGWSCSTSAAPSSSACRRSTPSPTSPTSCATGASRCGWPGVRSGARAEIQASGLVDHLGNPDLHADLDAAAAAFAGGERPTPPSA
jgi:hypothetical protein